MPDAQTAQTSPGPTRPPRVLLGVPAYGAQVWAGTLNALLNAVARLQQDIPGVQIRTLSIDYAEIDWIRNVFATLLLDQDYDLLVMVDADMAFPPEAISRLIRSGHDVCGLIYPYRKLDLRRLHSEGGKGVAFDRALSRAMGFVGSENLLIEDGQIEITDGFVRMTAIPTGCICIRKPVVQRMWEAFPDLQANNPGDAVSPAYGLGRVARLFDNIVDADGRRYSEDFSFCFRWRSLGGSVHALVDLPVTHNGQLEVQGVFLDYLQDLPARR